MTALPFVVQPRRQPIQERIGTDDSGIVEIERRGYLTSGEKAFVQQVQQLDEGTSDIVKLTRQIARKYALGMDTAYTVLIGIISNNPDPKDEDLSLQIEVDFAEELNGTLTSLAAGQTREELVFACCMIRYRIDPNFQISNIHDIHPDLIKGLAALYREEEARSLEAFNKSDEVEPEQKISVEEAEKKPVKTRESRSKTTTGA